MIFNLESEAKYIAIISVKTDAILKTILDC